MNTFVSSLKKALLSATILASSCASIDQEYAATVAGRSELPPQSSSNEFDSAVRCMDDLLLRANTPKGVPITTVGIKDNTQSVSAGSRGMIIGTLGGFSERSRLFDVISSISFGAIDRVNFVVEGEITEYDRGIIGEGGGVGAKVDSFSTGLGNTEQVSTVALAIWITDIATGRVVPGTHFDHRAVITQTSKSADVRAEIGTVAGSLDFSWSRSDALHQTVRSLVNLGLIASVGAFTQTPYAQCVATMANEKAEDIRHWQTWDKWSPDERRQAVLTLMKMQSVDPQIQRAKIANYQASMRLPATGSANFDTYTSLVRRPDQARFPKIGNDTSVKIAGVGGNFFVDPGSGWDYAVAPDRISFSISTAADSYAACWYRNWSGDVTMVFPNTSSPAGRISVDTPVTIPSNYDTFIIRPDRLPDGSAPKFEELFCAADADPIMAKLPSSIIGDQAEMNTLYNGSMDRLETGIANRLSARASTDRYKFLVVNFEHLE